tara:strand:- start:8911 stop:12375 length:3465 start_codon:yes stop_codon:yes gene_type:complete
VIGKSKLDSISNYNLSYENFLEAINDFDGFVLGSSYNDIFLFTEDQKIKKAYTAASQEVNDEKDPALDNFVKNIASRILDRTTGTYFFSDMFNGNMHDRYFPYITNYAADNKLNNIGDFLHIYLPVKGSNRSGIKAFNNNAFVDCVPRVKINNVIQQSHMGDHICYFTDTKQVRVLLTGSDGKAVFTTTAQGNKVVKQYTQDISPSGERKHPEINRTEGSRQGDRFHTPNLCAMVVRHPKASLSGRNKSHLPIFFNTISPIEMSKCTPYINIQILSLNYGNKKNRIGNLNTVSYLRFVQNKSSGDFILSDDSSFGKLGPVQKSESITDKLVRENDYDYSFMDVFAAPQMLSNAKINKENGNLLRNANINDPVLDPIMPFMSLKNLNVNITGAGYGIMSSKRASLSLVLHDRSRLTDIAPLVSSTQFATTKIIVEYGWSHPEGGVGSDNVIGKYLDGIKDRSVFQVVGSKFDFGDGGSVNIDVDLAAYGFRQTERVHAGAGPEVPLNSLQNLIEKATSDLIKDSKNRKEAPEIRQEIKMNSRSARSIESMISWDAYRAIAVDLKSNDTKKILNNLETILAGKTESDGTTRTAGLSGILQKEKEKVNAVKRVFGKLAEIESDDSVDAFLVSTVTGGESIIGDEESEDSYTDLKSEFVSVGKLVSQFVGHPLAATGLYDEVQLVFYPINHHAGGGRAHTTASFPIQKSTVELKFLEAIKNNSHISTKSAFALIEKLMRNKNEPAYGLSDLLTQQNNIVSADANRVRAVVKSRLEEGRLEDLNIVGKDAELIAKITQTETVSADDFNGWLSNETAVNDINVKAQEIVTKLKETQAEIAAEEAKNPPNNTTLIVLRTREVMQRGELKAQEQALTLAQYRSKRYNEIVKTVRKQISIETSTNITERCRQIYDSDGLKELYPAESKFIRPNLAMNFEVLDVISPPDYSKKETSYNGLIENKQILRIHVYDEEALPDPSKYAVLNSLIEGTGNKMISGKNYEKVQSYFKGLNFNDVKQIVKRSYPTIIYGAANSTIKTLSVSSNTSGEMANVLMVEAYGNLKKGQVEGFNAENEFDSIVMFPNTVSISMLGMPMIGRGNSIFIDFGTNTSVDNIYTVKSISHSIGAGNFTSTVSVVPSNMGAISNFKEKLSQSISKIRENLD